MTDQPETHDPSEPTSFSIEPERWYSLPHLAWILDVPLDSVYKWSSRGEPDFPKCTRLPNRRIRVRGTDLLTWLEGLAA